MKIRSSKDRVGPLQMSRFIDSAFVWCVAVAMQIAASQASTADDSSGAAGPELATDASPCERQDETRLRFSSASTDALQLFKADTVDGVAIRAAWEEIRRTLPKRNPEVEELSASKAVPVQHVPYFLGFLAGRLHTLIPQWWAEELRNAHAHNQDSLVLFREYPHRLGPRGLPPEFGIVPAIVREHPGEAIIVTWDNGTFRLPAAAMPREAGEAFAGIVAGRHCFIAHYQAISIANYHLCCIDIQTAKVLWTRKVWCGCATVGGISGPMSHEVALVCRQDRIFLYGMEQRAAYIEAFRSDGTTILRFNTTY